MFDLAWLLIAFPAAGALINLFVGHRLEKKMIGFIGAGAVGASFLVTLGPVSYTHLDVYKRQPDH